MDLLGYGVQMKFPLAATVDARISHLLIGRRLHTAESARYQCGRSLHVVIMVKQKMLTKTASEKGVNTTAEKAREGPLYTLLKHQSR